MLSLYGCNNNYLREILVEKKLTGIITVGINFLDANDKKVQVGIEHFFSRLLGADRNTTCVSASGEGDDISLPVGVLLHDFLDPEQLEPEDATHNGRRIENFGKASSARY